PPCRPLSYARRLALHVDVKEPWVVLPRPCVPLVSWEPSPSPSLSGLLHGIEHTPDFDDQVVGQTRFGDKRIAAGLARALRRTRQRMPGQRDHGNVLGSIIRLQH